MYAISQPGKQLRSRLVVEASRVGGLDDPRVVLAARAVELLHAATLAHDDVVDDSPLRRGRASLDSELGGFAAAYAGTWLFSTAIELATRCGDETLALFARSASEICDGELLETQDLHNPDRTRERYLSSITGKTAMLFAVSARSGGLLGGAPPDVCLELERYGLQLGIAFQLADDILDLLGDDDAIGKEPGNDIRHGVFTLPTIYAVEADPDLRELLTGDRVERELPLIIDRIHSTGACARALGVCDEHAAAARAAAREIGASALETFVDRALMRLDGLRE